MYIDTTKHMYKRAKEYKIVVLQGIKTTDYSSPQTSSTQRLWPPSSRLTEFQFLCHFCCAVFHFPLAVAVTVIGVLTHLPLRFALGLRRPS